MKPLAALAGAVCLVLCCLVLLVVFASATTLDPRLAGWDYALAVLAKLACRGTSLGLVLVFIGVAALTYAAAPAVADIRPRDARVLATVVTLGGLLLVGMVVTAVAGVCPSAGRSWRPVACRWSLRP